MIFESACWDRQCVPQGRSVPVVFKALHSCWGLEGQSRSDPGDLQAAAQMPGALCFLCRTGQHKPGLPYLDCPELASACDCFHLLVRLKGLEIRAVDMQRQRMKLHSILTMRSSQGLVAQAPQQRRGPSGLGRSFKGASSGGCFAELVKKTPSVGSVLVQALCFL